MLRNINLDIKFKYFYAINFKYSQRIEVKDLITIVWEMKPFSMSDEEKKIMYGLINNEPRNLNKKYEKLIKFISYFEKKKNNSKNSLIYDFTGLLNKELVELEKPRDMSSHDQGREQDRLSKNYKLTNSGLIHIFSSKFVYSPNFLVRYHQEVVLRELLYKYFELDTIRSSSAKFFVLITEYLADVSRYLLGYHRISNRSLSKEIQEDVEFNLRLFALALGFRIAILFKESNLISTPLEGDSEKAILALYQMETNMKKNLSKDSKLLNLISQAVNELEKAHAELLNGSRSN